jgi:NAD(P)H-dependent FMN reductase
MVVDISTTGGKTMPKLLVITASTRPSRSGPARTDWFLDRAAHHGTFEIEGADLAVLDLPFLDEPNHPSDGLYTKSHTFRWSATVAAADAFVIVMPEYNNGFCAPIKNAIDFLYAEWQYKPVGFVSYSGGSAGGTRAAQMLKPVLLTLKMTPLGEMVAIPYASDLIHGGAFGATDSMNDSAAEMLDELEKVQEALAPLREGRVPQEV